jgi:hypothetical protein
MTTEDPRPNDARFVEGVRERFVAASLTREQTAAFDRKLLERISKRRFEMWQRPLTVAATASAVLASAVFAVWLIGPPQTEPVATPIASSASSPERPSLDRPSVDRREELRFDPADEAVLEFGTAALANLEDSLPDEYRAIDELFLGEV